MCLFARQQCAMQLDFESKPSVDGAVVSVGVWPSDTLSIDDVISNQRSQAVYIRSR